MTYPLPHTIQNVFGEKLIFKRLEAEPDGDRLIVENFVAPQSGPPMHVHFHQDESLTVVSGQLAYQIAGEEPRFAGPGETVTFQRGVPHRFWNAGNDTLNCHGWVKPAHSIVFYLSSIYAAQNRSGKHQPELFDGAYLTYRYRREYDMPEVPGFVKRVIIPVVYGLGWVLGKYRKFKNAPAPL